MKLEDVRRDLQAVGRQMVDLGLAWGNAGNISARTDADRFLITATGTRLGELADDDFAECSLQGVVTGERKPSKEVPMHRAVYEVRPEINVILHASPFYSTLIACSQIEIRRAGSSNRCTTWNEWPVCPMLMRAHRLSVMVCASKHHRPMCCCSKITASSSTTRVYARH